MTTEFAEFHDELRAVAVDLLAKDRAVHWPVLAEAGWTGLEIPDDLGGAGATFTEVGVICEEIGKAAGASDHLGGAVLSVGALKALQPDETRSELLAGIAAGEFRTAVVLEGFRLQDGKLAGRAEFVPDALGAGRLLVIAADTDGTPVLAVTAGCTVTAQPVVDETRRMATVVADDVAIDAVLRFTGDASAAVRALHDRAAVAVACDSLGLAQAMLDATVSYVKVRTQFDRPIGSFQAVKHACADMMVKIAVARRLVADAAAAIATGADAALPSSMAKAYCCGVAVEIAGKAMQLHGGIGYTWESGIHVYLKRAALNRSLFGSPTAHRQRLSQRYSQRYSSRSH